MTQTRASLPIFAVLAAAILIAGCHRGFYRRQANVEAKRLIAEKNSDPRWDSADGDITIDPQSRMFNPFSEDHPPMPQDDPASHQFMQCVDGRPGYSQWQANGNTNFAENPEWLAYLPVNEKGEVVIDLERAVDLAFLHSTTYQAQKEQLYLSALDVSLERFGFDGQLTTGFNSFFRTQGRLAAGGSSTTLTNSIGANGGGLNWRKLGITGANFAVGVANTVLWNFAGANTQTATSLIDFSLIQPLLRNAGRDRILESLTQSERTLLANVRQMDRFRRGFYMQVAVGRSPGAGPGSNFLGLPQGAQGPGGFVGLLQTRQLIRNQQFAVRQVQNVLNQFQELFDSDQIDNLQLVQVESQLYNSQQSLLSLRISYQDSLDRFKQTLGIPPHINVVIDDAFLRRFELTSDDLNERQVSLDELRTSTGQALILLGDLLPDVRPLTPDDRAVMDEDQIKALEEKIAKDPQRGFASNPDLTTRVTDLIPFLDNALKIVDQIKTVDKTQIDADFETYKRVRPERVKYLSDFREVLISGQLNEFGQINPSLLDSDPESLATLEDYPDKKSDEDDPKMLPGLQSQLDEVMRKVGEIEAQLRTTKQQVESFPEVRDDLSEIQLFDFVNLSLLRGIPKQLTDLYNDILELSLLQAQARSNSISLAEVDLNAKTALEIARCMRLDWMNARAALVDSWREIEVVADQLEAQVDLVFEGSIGNFGDNPFKIRGETGTLNAGLRFDSPIVRQAERNAYRQTLIQYQQARRAYYRFEDEISRNLRESLRGTNLNKILFELNRRNIQVQIKQVEQARLRLDEPARIQQGGGRSSFSNTVAQDLLRAIQGLNQAQDRYLSEWVSFEVARRNLDFDLGTMQLDELGRWIDPGDIDETIGHRAAALMGIDPSCLDCVLMNLDGAGEAINLMPMEMMAPGMENQSAPRTDGRIPNSRVPQSRLLPELRNIEPIVEPQGRRVPILPTPEAIRPQSNNSLVPQNPFARTLERALGNRRVGTFR